MKSLLKASLVICAGSLLAATTHAGPVEHLWHGRDNSAAIVAEGSENLSDGYRYTSMSAEEYYDVKGTVEYGELYMQEITNLATGLGFRSLRCPLERGLVKVLGGAHAASFETTVDLDTVGCELWGYWYDLASGDMTPYGFSGMVHVFINLTGRHSQTSDSSKVTQTFKDGFVDRFACTSDSGREFEDARVEINGVSLAEYFSAFAYRSSCLYSGKQK